MNAFSLSQCFADPHYENEESLYFPRDNFSQYGIFPLSKTKIATSILFNLAGTNERPILVNGGAICGFGDIPIQITNRLYDHKKRGYSYSNLFCTLDFLGTKINMTLEFLEQSIIKGLFIPDDAITWDATTIYLNKSKLNLLSEDPPLTVLAKLIDYFSRKGSFSGLTIIEREPKLFVSLSPPVVANLSAYTIQFPVTLPDNYLFSLEDI